MGLGGTSSRFVAALGLASTAFTLSVSEDVSTNTAHLLTTRDEKDPTDFSWVVNWAAIGDSFTAGIGSGHQLGSSIGLNDAWKCSRYDYSWAKIVDDALGSSVKNFQFEACSGDRTDGIYEQVDELRNSLDVVMMTAGGNDLCLGAMIKTCVIMPWDGEDACEAIIDKAQENIDTILKDNIRQVLTKLNGKIKKDGALVYSGYAPFFNTDNEDCADPKKQNWALKGWRWWQFWNWLNTSLKLTIDRRKKFNTLVEGINNAISEVVEEFDKDTAIGYRATFSDWSSWPGIVDGQFCSPKSTGWYPDPEQPDLLFIKFNTAVSGTPPHDETKRRDLGSGNSSGVVAGAVDIDSPEPEEHDSGAEEMKRRLEAYQDQLRGRLTRKHIYDSLLWKSSNPRAEVLHKLDARAPTAPGCPGDNLPGVPLGLGLPDSFLSIFHPNKQGHEAMAGYALQNLVYVRAQILGVDDGLCTQARDDFTCWQKSGRKAYVDFARVDENYKDFCNDVKPDADTINWKWEKKYHEGTPDEHTIVLQLRDGASSFDKDQCLESLDRIINSCDGGDDKNPLNFKFGGRWIRGNYDYQINPKKDRDMITKRDGTCRGWWKLFFTSYRIYGRGWASYEHGQKTLLKSMRDCGSAVTGWKFDYCDGGCGADGVDDYEWVAEFNLPVYGGVACMKNNWVPRRSSAEWYSEGSTTLGCIGAA
ncbi:lipase [Colletotrichum liriopes]|uniref:Lipase n=1 Tax=Colletotrichum liriopes TaxID=708192 RepID=A0AA37H0Z5_9PEZI|nr:lipase [Colletotrichum liriopes]